MTHTTMDSLITRKRISFVWNYEKDEEWLTSLSAQGEHLVMPGTFSYQFKQDTKVRYVYRMDYHPIREKDELDSYYALFEDAGWEHVGSNLSWHYFRKPHVSNEPSSQIYTDYSSLKQLLKRIQWMLVILAVANVPTMILNIVNVWKWLDESSTVSGLVTFALVLQALAVILLLYGTVRFQRKIRRLDEHMS